MFQCSRNLPYLRYLTMYINSVDILFKNDTQTMNLCVELFLGWNGSILLKRMAFCFSFCFERYYLRR